METGNNKTIGSDNAGNPADALSVDEFRAELEVFSGPLDLLLHLIRREEVDIMDIPISKITDSYLSTLKAMEMFDINIASEFLVMAATLMDIKSSSLLPDPIDEEEEDDSRDDLINKLLEYKKYKQLASKLRVSAEAQAQTYPRQHPPPEISEREAGIEAILSDINIWDCVSAYSEILREIEDTRPQQIIYDEVPVSHYMDEVMSVLSDEGGEKNFLSFFNRNNSRPRIIGVFLALLELLRQGKVQLVQQNAERAYIIICKAPDNEQSA